MKKPQSKPARQVATSEASSKRRLRTGQTGPPASRESQRARRKFLRVFPDGFWDEDYVALERAYKWNAHQQWEAVLNHSAFTDLLAREEYQAITSMAVRIESRTNLLFSFEKMALRDAVRDDAGAKVFAKALYQLLYDPLPIAQRFERWIESVDSLPRRQTRVLTWPLTTVFGFLARPCKHFFFKPTVMREAFRRYGYELAYAPRPSGPLYLSVLQFVGRVRRDLRDLAPRDMIDLQSFLWVQGSDEYPD